MCGRALHCFLSLRQILYFAKYKPLQGRNSDQRGNTLWIRELEEVRLFL